MQECIFAPAFPEKIYALAEKWQVGTPVKVYKSGKLWQFVIGFLMISLFTCLLLATIQNYLSLQASLNDTLLHCTYCSDAGRARLLLDNTQILSSTRNQIYLSVFLLALWVGIMSLFVSASFCLRMHVCSDGLLRVFGPKVLAIRWEEIARVSWRSNAQARFFLADGRKYTWLSLGLDFPELAQDVKSRLGLRVRSGHSA